jgi:hypothetical protein
MTSQFLEALKQELDSWKNLMASIGTRKVAEPLLTYIGVAVFTLAPTLVVLFVWTRYLSTLNSFLGWSIGFAIVVLWLLFSVGVVSRWVDMREGK